MPEVSDFIPLIDIVGVVQIQDAGMGRFIGLGRLYPAIINREFFNLYGLSAFSLRKTPSLTLIVVNIRDQNAAR